MTVLLNSNQFLKDKSIFVLSEDLRRCRLTCKGTQP